ncbi:neurexin-3-like [Acropora millepora]|uniref:neurexin-3-like n=1 Tax=Acropora millepora TaxID=45264 RepID=UPI001CF1CAC9|nr:neurexin-3-like [Acropora millepora]
MEATRNLPCLLHLLLTLVFRCDGNSVTFINESSSFIQLKNWDVSESRGLGFRFKTFMSEALLLYIDDEAKSNFLRVELFQGRLRLTCSHGSRFGEMAVEIGDNLNDLQWHPVLLERVKGQTTISLNGQSKSTVDSRKRRSLNITSPIYFGGIPPKLEASRITQPSVLRLRRFVGCLADIEMFEYSARQGKKRKLAAIWEKENAIAPGCTNMCDIENQCQNGGQCLNRFITTDCGCATTGFRGKTCTKGLPVLGLKLSDYVIYNRSYKAISSQQDRIILRFKTTNQNSSILESGLGRDYLVIELYRGFLLVRWNLGSGELNLHVRERPCDDGKWHSMDLVRNRRRLDLTLDGEVRKSRTFPGRFVSFNLGPGQGDVYIGGILPSHHLSKRSRSLGRGFDGCLQEFFINDVDVVQGVLTRDDAFRVKGRPKPRCEDTREPISTILTRISSRWEITTTQSTKEGLTTLKTNLEKRPLPASSVTSTISPKTSPEESTVIYHSVSTTSRIPCTDDDCDVEKSGSGDEDYSGETRRPWVAKETSFVDSRDNNIKEPEIDINESVKKTPGTDDGLVGEPDISQENCIEDDEDGCNDDANSGQSSTAEGSSAGSAATTTTTLPGIDSKAREGVPLKTKSTKKGKLIAGIVVVASLLVVFCIFAVWWLLKHRNDLYWKGSYRVEVKKEKTLKSEVTDV